MAAKEGDDLIPDSPLTAPRPCDTCPNISTCAVKRYACEEFYYWAGDGSERGTEPWKDARRRYRAGQLSRVPSLQWWCQTFTPAGKFKTLRTLVRHRTGHTKAAVDAVYFARYHEGVTPEMRREIEAAIVAAVDLMASTYGDD